MMKFVLAALAMIALGPVGARAQVPAQTQITAPALSSQPTPTASAMPQNCLGSLPMNGGSLCGPLTITSMTTSATDQPLISLTRITSHSGGTFGYVDFAERIYLDVGAPVTNFEWAIVAILDNHATAGENVAGYFQANKYANGPTWAAVMECADKTVTPTSVNGAMPCIEVDVGAAGLDDYNSVGLRGGITIGSNSQNTTVPTEVGWGVRVTDSQYSSFLRGFYVGAKFEIAAFDASTGTATSHNGVMAAAFRSNPQQIWDFSGNSTAYWWLNTGVMQYATDGIGVVNISRGGDITSLGQFTGHSYVATPSVNVDGFQVTGNAGASGLDTSQATLAAGALLMAAGQSICFEQTCNRTLSYAGATQRLNYTVTGSTVFSVDSNGIVNGGHFVAAPTINTSGFQVTGVAGANGFDTSTATLANAALIIAAGQRICYEATCARTLSYDTASSNLYYMAGALHVFTISGTGDTTALGIVSGSQFVAAPTINTDGFKVTGNAGANGFDSSAATLANASLLMAAGQKICFEVTCARTLNYDGVTQNLYFIDNALHVFTISGAGDTTAPGIVSGGRFTSAPTTTTAAFQVTGTAGSVGFDTALATLATASLRMSAGQNICLEIACGSTLSYDTASTSLRYTVTGTVQFAVDSTGIVSANSYRVGAVAGLSCAGTPTASFASTNGIVTHC